MRKLQWYLIIIIIRKASHLQTQLTQIESKLHAKIIRSSYSIGHVNEIFLSVFAFFVFELYGRKKSCAQKEKKNKFEKSLGIMIWNDCF